MKIIGIILIVVSIILILFKRHQNHKSFNIRSANSTSVKELETTAHSITQEIGSGNWRDYVKVWGKISCQQPLFSELKQEPCLYYTMTIRREYEETIRKQDSQGRGIEETRRSSEIVANNERKIPFILNDQTSEIMVNPEGAIIDTVKILDEFRQEETRGKPFSFGNFSLVLKDSGSGRRTLGYRYTESILPLECEVLIVGEVSDETGKLTLKKPLSKNKDFIISLKTEQALIHKIKQTETILLFSAIASATIGIILIIVTLI